MNGELTRNVLKGVSAELAIFAACMMMPLLGVVFSVFMPLPSLFYRVKLGPRAGALVPAAAAGFMGAAVGQPSFDLLLFGCLMLLGYLMGNAYERGHSVERTVALPCAATLAVGVTTLSVAANLAGDGLVPLLTAFMTENMKLTLELYRELGVDKAHLDLVAEHQEAIVRVLVHLLPAMALTGLLLAGWTTVLLSSRLLPAKGLPFPNFGPLNEWRAPEQLVWGVIAGGLMLFPSDENIRTLGVSLLMVLAPVYFFAGIALVSFYCDRKRLPRPVRVLIYSLIAIQQLLLLVVIVLGFFDMWINFRKFAAPADRSE